MPQPISSAREVTSAEFEDDIAHFGDVNQPGRDERSSVVEDSLDPRASRGNDGEKGGLTSWAKTTGGRGLHVVVPIKPAREVSECLEFSRGVSDAIAKTDPQLYTTTFAKAGRERKILIDYLRNNRTNTSVCAYSPRARPGATVSMPLDWSDLTASPERWTLLTAAKRLNRLRSDPWARYWDCHQEISDATFAAVQAL